MLDIGISFVGTRELSDLTLVTGTRQKWRLGGRKQMGRRGWGPGTRGGKYAIL